MASALSVYVGSHLRLQRALRFLAWSHFLRKTGSPLFRKMLQRRHTLRHGCDAIRMRDSTRSPKRDGGGIRFLLGSLALQNLGRRKARTFLLLAAVAICSGAIFTGAVLLRSIESSMDVGFTRLGADLLVIPEGTLTNITAALLTAEPTSLTLDSDMARSSRGPQGRAASCSATDLSERSLGLWRPRRGGGPDRVRSRTRSHCAAMAGTAARPPAAAEATSSSAGDATSLSAPSFCSTASRLSSTASSERPRSARTSAVCSCRSTTMDGLRTTIQQICGTQALLEPNKISGVLIELAPGATIQRVRFAILANVPGVKVVGGESMLTAIRQGLAALLNGVLALVVDHVRQHGDDDQRVVLGHYHGAAARAGAAQGDRRAAQTDHRDAVDRSHDRDHGRRRAGMRVGSRAHARLRAFPGLLSREFSASRLCGRARSRRVSSRSRASCWRR